MKAVSKVSVCIVRLASECILDTFILQYFFIFIVRKKTPPSSSLFTVSKTHLQLRVFLLSFQELSPTSDTNLIQSLMNLMDCMMDEFADEAKVKAMNDHDILSWLEVGSLFNIQNREFQTRL